MTFTLPKLSYEFDVLEPYIDAKTMEIHHEKHHATYVKKLNETLEKYPDFFNKDINEILKNIRSIPENIKQAVINHGGGHSNHTLFWDILSKDKTKLSEELSEAITKKFGSLDEFKKKFSDIASSKFGSGWAWLIVSNKELEITSTSNQDSPLMNNQIPILGLDLWEHAYYLKYQNRRTDYIEAFWNVVNWEKVSENFKLAKH
ncbi:MAG: superoxide dismutase [Nanoarchaeota archaeon]